MSQRTQKICDNCGRVKQESNNWFKLWVWEESRAFSTFINSQANPYFFTNSQCVNTYDPVPRDFCGQECLIAEIHRVINLPDKQVKNLYEKAVKESE